jgi:molybdopterin-guanine dinucleotide biosynthesis protein MobB
MPSGKPPIVCFVGRSGSGKTTLLIQVIARLRARGRRVAAAKHDPHGHAALDMEGKDSWRLKEAGAESVAIVSPDRIACVSDAPEGLTLEDVRDRCAGSADVLLAEGWKRSAHPKIEVARKALAPELVLGAEDGLLAVATDFEIEAGVPRLDLNDPAAVADFLEARVLRPKAGP